MDATPKIIRITKANGDFYEGVSLEFLPQFGPEAARVRLYVTASNVDALRGTTEPGTIVEMSLSGWTVEAEGGKPKNGFTIIDDDGTSRPALMDQKEYEGWRNGNSGTSNDLKVIPKRDFGSTGSYMPSIRANIREGWNVVFTKGLYKGAQAMPGAVWSATYEGAMRLIQVYVAAGGNTDSSVENDAGFADRFHALSRLTITKDA